MNTVTNDNQHTNREWLDTELTNLCNQLMDGELEYAIQFMAGELAASKQLMIDMDTPEDVLPMTTEFMLVVGADL